MAKIPRYPNDSDIQMRLGHSYVRYDGQAAFVQATGNFKLSLIKSSKVAPFLVHVDDPLLDISSPPAGYAMADNDKGAWWVARMPLRQQKQGLEAHVVQSYFECADFGRTKIGGLPALDDTLRMINGEYTPIDGAIFRLYKERLASIPISRDFCLVLMKGSTRALGLKFMGNPIGLLDSKTRQAVLSYKYSNGPVAATLAENFSIEVQNVEQVI